MMKSNSTGKKNVGRGVAFVDRDTVRDAVDHLRIARNLLVGVSAPKAADKVRRALRSAEGARRHIAGLHSRVFPPNHEWWRTYRPRPSIFDRFSAGAIEQLDEEDIRYLSEVVAGHLVCTYLNNHLRPEHPAAYRALLDGRRELIVAIRETIRAEVDLFRTQDEDDSE
jgi:hypothetical protein